VSSSNKRERELARQKYERQQERRAQQSAARRRRNQVTAVVASLAVVAVAVVALVLSSRSGSDATASPSATPTGSGSASASPSSTGSVAGCTTAPTPTTKTQTWAKPGGSPVVAGTTYRITLDTNCGPITIQLVKDAAAKAPKTSQSMNFLSDQGYYTDSDCFRLTTSGIFVLQCGSPTNDGQGGPGYQLPDENLPKTAANNYPAGTVAMANAGPGTAGSQFFIVYKDTSLPASYTIWGNVVSGLDIVSKIAGAGVASGTGDGKPNQPIVITKATTSETPQAG
jgi:peptidyl-prolyl cis-trans isomerase B (cyclophilin B)